MNTLAEDMIFAGADNRPPIQDKTKESCMVSYRILHSHLKVLSLNDLSKGGLEWAFTTLFDQDVNTFTGTMLLNLDQLEKQLDKAEFQEIGSFDAFRYFLAYTRTEVQQFRDTLIQHMKSVKKSIAERARHQKQYDRRVKETQMQMQEGEVDKGKALDADSVVTKSNGTKSENHVTSIRSGNDTHAEDANIKLVNDKEPVAKVQLTAEHNVLANEQQHTEQFEPIYDTYLLEKFDSNTTPISTNMSLRGGEID
ncbi:hypothetical protein Tco_0370165 [Tanacetum coccineum]